MKKAIALVSAAAMIFAAAGCTNKRTAAEPDITEELSSSSEISVSDTSAQEGSAAQGDASDTKSPTSQTMIVIVTGGKEYGIQQPDYTSIVELVTTIAPQKPRPTVTSRPSTTKAKTTTKPAKTTAPEATAQVTSAQASTSAVTTAPGTAVEDSSAKTTSAFVAPVVVYNSTYTVGEGNKQDVVKFISHTCEEKMPGVASIGLSLKTEKYSGTRQTITFTYNCYGADSQLINKKPMSFIVPLSKEAAAVSLEIAAPKGTAKVEIAGCQ